MWRPWDRDLQQVQDQWDSDRESSDGIPVLSSDMEYGKRTDSNYWDCSPCTDDASSHGLPKPYLYF